MTIGLGIFLIVLGAIIRYALDVEVAGVDESTLGLILILGGIATVVLSLVMARYWATRRPVADPRVDPRAERPVDPRY